MHAELHRSTNDGRWRFKIIDDNGEPIAASEAYFTKWNAKRGARNLVPGIECRTVK